MNIIVAETIEAGAPVAVNSQGNAVNAVKPSAEDLLTRIYVELNHLARAAKREADERESAFQYGREAGLKYAVKEIEAVLKTLKDSKE